jgi:hydroxymethylpyrimidine pyrophosphatase-like HAD family hydrolase
MPDQPDIRLISLDFDGTALERDEKHLWLADEIVELLNRLGERGVRWCVNSGRGYQNQWGLVQACRPLENMPVALLSGERFIHWLSPKFAPHEPFNSLMHRKLEVLYPAIREALDPHRDRLRHAYDFNYEQDADLIVGWNLDSAMRALIFINELRGLLGGVPDAQIIQNDTWVIVHHRDAGKGVILTEAARHLELDRTQILAIGDHQNDLDMLDGRAAAWVGCPADADAEVQAVVRDAGGIVARGEHAQGTAEILRQVFEIAE